MRRAMRHAELLGAREPLMWKLVPALTREMGQAYPELLRAEALITETLKLEETRFRRTLERGLAILDEKSKSLKKGAMFDGETAFTLYDTYGFPLDLTQDALRSRGISVDIASFTDAMDRQREKARASWAGSGEAAQETVWFALREKTGATEFLGYETESAEGVVAALMKDGKEVSELKKGESGAVVMNQTPFYGESGGQIGDIGEMRREGVRVTVSDTQKKAGDLFAHMVTVEQGTIKVGDPLLLEVDQARRGAIRQNHTATHLLHEALRKVLGDHVAQKGSLVAPDRLRFDFSHPKPLSPEEIEKVEDIANEVVLQNAPVTTRLMAVDDAIASGARALFGEKYGDEVRVVAIGDGTGNTMGWSVELCGGTHVRRTGDIGLISVVGEAGVAAGVRRIEALTGKAARKSANKQLQVVKAAAAELKVPLEEMPGRIGALLDERKKLERDLSDAKKKLAMGGGGKAAAKDEITLVRGVQVLSKELPGVKFSDLRGIADDYKKQLGSGVVILTTSSDEGKASLVVGVTPDLTPSNNAIKMVQIGVSSIGGSGGGGRPDLAQGGGTNPSGSTKARDEIKQLVKPVSTISNSEN
jgi:alanyl-tRNA synthetase